MVKFLHLEDGTVLRGVGFGYDGDADGEVVFSTGMTGYIESMTDPSFAGEILVFTYPLIGNYGVPKREMLGGEHVVTNFESEQIWAKGIVVSSFSEIPSHYQSVYSIDAWMRKEKIPGIWGIDTRALTQKLREAGTVRGSISTKRVLQGSAHRQVCWVAATSCKKTIFYPSKQKNSKHVVLIDCGVKHGIIRALLQAGFCISRIPWNADPLSIPYIDGVVCSNGPGDPKDCKITVDAIAAVIKKGIPYLGICLGHQLLALAIGADTYKLPYGHRGLNQPCIDRLSNKAYVTSQNHGYAVRRETIPSGFSEWFTNLNDHTVEGLIGKRVKAWSVQFHPEGCPGPDDTAFIFDMFAREVGV